MMQERAAFYAFTIVIGLASHSWAEEPYRLLYGAELSETTGVYDHLPEDNGELVAIASNDNWVVGTLIYIVTKPYEKVVSLMRETTNLRFGERAFMERIATVEGPTELPGISKDDLERGREHAARLELLGIRSGLKFREALLTSLPYNKTASGSEYSVLHIRIVETNPFFGPTCTLIAISRVDHTREWLRMFHLGLPIPIKEDSRVALVSSTELAFIKMVNEQKELSLVGPIVEPTSVISDGPSNPIYHFNTMERVKARVGSECQQ